MEERANHGRAGPVMKPGLGVLRLAAMLFMLTGFGGTAGAEPIYSVTIIDMMRTGSGDATRAHLLLAVRSHDLPEFPDADRCRQYYPPEEADIYGPGSYDPGCYALRIRDLDGAEPAARQVNTINLGVHDDTDFLLVDYPVRPEPPGQRSAYSVSILLGVFNGLYSDNPDQLFDSDQMPGLLNPKRPFDYLYHWFDDRLNNSYRRLSAALAANPDERQALVRQERLWLKTLARTCPALRPASSIADDEGHKRCLLKQTAARLAVVDKKVALQQGR